jgi:hypothetical protein
VQAEAEPAPEREKMLPGAPAAELAAAPKRPSFIYINRLGLSILLFAAIAALAAVLVCLFPPTAGFAMALMLLASMPTFAAFGSGAGAAVIATAGIVAAASVPVISGIGLLVAHYGSKLINFVSTRSARGGFEPAFAGPAGGGTGGEVNLGLNLPVPGHPATYAEPASFPAAPASDAPASGHASSYAAMGGGLKIGPRTGGGFREPVAAATGSEATASTRRPLPPLHIASPSDKDRAVSPTSPSAAAARHGLLPRDRAVSPTSPSAEAAARHGLLPKPAAVDGVDAALDALAADAAPGTTASDRPAP